MTKLSEILDVSVSDLLGTTPEKKEDLSDIAVQLQNLNDLIAMHTRHQRDIVKKIKIAVAVILLLLAIGAIYPKWNEIWYEFGQNLYRLINS